MKAREFFNINGNELKYKNYTKFVEVQIKDMEVDDLITVDIGSKTVQDFRMTSRKIAKKLGYSLRTKELKGKLYVGRIL